MNRAWLFAACVLLLGQAAFVQQADEGWPMHGGVDNIRYSPLAQITRDNVAKLKKQGRSLDETIAARPTAAYDAKWGQLLIEPAFFTRLVYQGV